MSLKKMLVSAFAVYFAFAISFMFFEPEISEAAADNTDVYLTVTSEITLSCDASSTLVGTINSISGGVATNTFSCTIKTPDPGGYNMTVAEDHTLQATTATTTNGYFADATTTIQYAWVVPGSGAEYFGFALNTGTAQAAQAYRPNGSNACNSAGGTVNGSNCWSGFALTTQKVISSTSPTASGGDAANFMLKAQAGSANFLTSGQYHNIITLTATAGAS